VTSEAVLPISSLPPRSRWRVGALVLVVAGIVVVAAVTLVPFSHRFADGFNATHRFGSVSMVAPEGSRLSLNWLVSGGPASVSVFNGHGQVLYASTASAGAFAFTTVTPSDGVEANSTSTAFVHLDWGYSAPLL
jgi:hypothetical protein